MENEVALAIALVITYGTRDAGGHIGRFRLSNADLQLYISGSIKEKWPRICYQIGTHIDATYFYSLARDYEKSPEYCIVARELCNQWKRITILRPSGNINDRQGQLADFSDKLKEFYLSLDDFCEGIWFYADIIKPFIDGRILYRDVHGLFEKVPCILRELVRLLGTGERPHLRVFVSHEMELDTIRKDRPINSSNISLLCVADEHLAKWRHPGSEFGGLMRQISAAYDSPFLDEKVGSPLRSISERPRRGRPPAVAPEKIVDEMRANPDASDGEIGKKLGVSRQTVRRVLDAYNGDDTEL